MLVVFSGNCGRSMYHFRLAAIKRLQDLGHTVKVVLPNDDYIERLRSSNIEIITLSQMELAGTNPLKDYNLYKEYLKIYKELHPDIIFQYTIKPNIYGTIAAKKLNIPCIAMLTGLGYTFIRKGFVPFLAKEMYRYSLKRASQVWLLNNEDKNFLESNGYVDKAKTLLLNGEGIDTNYYGYTPIDTSKRSFILIARLLYDKGVKEFYEAAKILKGKYPEATFKILGFVNDDDYRAVSKDELKKWVESGAIEYLGTTTDVRTYIKDSSCVVLPSFYKEGMSIALMEGASMGRPLIATNIAGCRELINDGETGYICNTKDPINLAEKMEKIINMDDAQLIEMGKKSREKMIAEFSLEKILPEYENVVKKANIN